MLSKYYESVEWEVEELRRRKQGKEVCRGQSLRGTKSLSFHCYDPLCDKQHCDHPEYKQNPTSSKGVPCHRVQIAVSELCFSFESARKKAEFVSTSISRPPATLRPLNDLWVLESEQAALHALFDETAELLAMLLLEVDDRKKKDCIDPDQVYGSRFLSYLKSAIDQLWRKELGLTDNVKVYKNIATHLRTLSEDLVKNGLKMLIDGLSLQSFEVNQTDEVLHVSRLQDEELKRHQNASRLPAFQEACSLVCKLAASSGAHADEGKDHFDLAGNLGNNYIIICNATVQACALYNQFVVAWYNRYSNKPELPPLDHDRLNEMQVGFSRYLSSLKKEALERVWQTLEQLEANHANVAHRRGTDGLLADYLRDWWTQKIGNRARSVT